MTAQRDKDYRKAHFYRRVKSYLEHFCETKQAKYKADEENSLEEMLDRIAAGKTLH